MGRNMMSIMRTLTLCCAVASAALSFTACGGGSGGQTVVPAIPAQSTTLGIETILGGPGFFAPNGFVVYTLSNETTTSLQCTVASNCVTTFVPLAPPNFALTTGFTTFVRPDNHVTQLAYLNQPIYTYAFDTGPGSASGQGLGTAGGTWNVARP
jgi:predicted lipoprotein with Yx(FWY)xxD motif